MSLEVLKNEIKSGVLKNLYLFFGPEDYLKRHYLSEISKILVSKELKVFNHVVLEGRVEPSAIIDQCDQLPAFSNKRLVVVKDSGLFKSKGKGSEGTEGTSKSSLLLDYLSHIPDTACIVFVEEEIDKRLKITDTVKKNGLLVEFAYQKPADLVKWVRNLMRIRKIDISPEAAQYLIDNSEPDMTAIYQEVEKLSIYSANNGIVSIGDIDSICTKSIKSKIFDLMDATAAGQAGKALKILDDMVFLKEPLPRILVMIARHYGHLMETIVLLREGCGRNELAGKLGVHPYTAEKLAKQSRNMALSDVKKALEACMKADVAVKTGRMNPRTALELVLAGYSN